MAEARYGHQLQFADGCWAMMFQYLPVKEGGEYKREIWFCPHTKMIELHDIKDSEYTKPLPNVIHPVIKRTYPESWFFPLNMTPGNESWFVFCKYNKDEGGEYVPPEKVFTVPNQKMREEALLKIIETQGFQLVYLQNELNKIAKSPDMIEDRTIKKVAEIAKSINIQTQQPQQYGPEVYEG